MPNCTSHNRRDREEAGEDAPICSSPSTWTPRPTTVATGTSSPSKGKPPDFVLEVASESTSETDLGSKRNDYARFGIPEYWRFDETGEYYGERLAGERLVDGEYRAIPIEQLAEDILQGHSDVLDLDIRWHDGHLEWYEPATGRHIVTLEEERAARIRAENRVADERSRADEAEARVRELEEELRRLR